MATKISHKVQEYQTLRPYLGNIPKKKTFFLYCFPNSNLCVCCLSGLWSLPSLTSHLQRLEMMDIYD